MRKSTKIRLSAPGIVLGAGIAIATLGMLGVAPDGHAAGTAPDQKICNDKDNPPKDAVTQGGCVVISRTKGNCMACHRIAGVPSGDIAPALADVSKRIPDKARLRAQVDDASKLNPNTVMPPFGRHGILTQDEVDKVVEFLMTL